MTSPPNSSKSTSPFLASSLLRTPIQRVLARGQAGEKVRVQGWVRTRRDSKGVTFLELNDGSCLAHLQVVAEAGHPALRELAPVTTGSGVALEGLLVQSPGAGQAVELRLERVLLATPSHPEYPLQKKRHTLEYLRTIAHLRMRSNTLGAVFRVRDRLFHAIHGFFRERGFLFLAAPIITASDAEGAGAMFRVTTLDVETPPRSSSGSVDWSKDFFGKGAHLTVSGQLEGEAFALAYHDVYTFGPTFRAENSNTARHAAEFWMVEPEMAFADLAADRALAEAFVREVLGQVLEQCREDFALFEKHWEPGLLAKLDHVVKSSFEVMDYGEAVGHLETSGEAFQFPVSWGADLQTEHERWLTEKKVGRPLFVVNYPKAIKAFYMRANDDGRTVAAMDLLVPGVGEIIGGSQREDREDVLRERMREMGLPLEDYQWYLDLRRYGGVPHAGFGMGFDRLLMYITGMSNIRDVIPFPRVPGYVEF
ncbi:MAG: asparagine--tRNA ligase [Deltaproteobacteria bacterium]|nr:asparagine--tRNA ligase [Deltaproteobacteria bacterium]